MSSMQVTLYIEVCATVRCQMERSDYGVPGSPVWYEPDPASFKVEDVSFDDVNIALASLPQNVQDMVMDAAIEAAVNKGEWEE